MQLSASAGHPYRAIAAAISKDIDEGRLRPEDRLPSVRELAKTFGVTVATAQRAVSQLATEGYITVIPGHGSFVRERPAGGRDVPALADQITELRKEVASLRSRLEAVEEQQQAARRRDSVERHS